LRSSSATYPLLGLDKVVATPHLGYVYFGQAFDQVVTFAETP